MTLADAMLLYAIALNRTLTDLGLRNLSDNPSGQDILSNSRGEFDGQAFQRCTHPGFSGKVIISSNGTRDPLFVLWGLNSNDAQTQFMLIETHTDGDVVQAARNIFAERSSTV